MSRQPDSVSRVRSHLARRAALESEFFTILLGPDCPHLQRKLFDCLCDAQLEIGRGKATKQRRRGQLHWSGFRLTSRVGFPLMEEAEVIEIVYGAAAEASTALAKFKGRLRSLQHAVNDRLMKHKAPFHVKRPAPGWLQLEDMTGAIGSTEPVENLPKAVQQRMDSATSLDEALEIYVSYPAKKEDTQPSPRILNCADCESVLQNLLVSGPRPMSDLRAACGNCSDATFRRAQKRLALVKFRQGYGAAGLWFAALPGRQDTAGAD